MAIYHAERDVVYSGDRMEVGVGYYAMGRGAKGNHEGRYLSGRKW